MRIAGRARFIGLLAALTVIAAMLTLGCGGGGDSGNSSGSTSKDSGSATSKQAKGPEEYTSQFCGVLTKYSGDLQELSNANTNMEDPAAMKDFIDKMGPLFEGISTDLDKINPPSDVAEWHNGVVSGMSNVADLFGKMGTALDKPFDEAMTEITDLSSQMNALDNPFGSMTDLPAEYQQAFKDNADCQDLQNLDIFQ